MIGLTEESVLTHAIEMQITIDIPGELLIRAKAIAVNTDTAIDDIVNDALISLVNKQCDSIQQGDAKLPTYPRANKRES